MPKISIAQSDGDPSNWPEGWKPRAQNINQNNNYHEKIDRTHIKYTLFCDKIGQHLAQEQGKSDAANYTLDDLPEGYALFLHHKLQPNGSDRTDIYLFGSTNVTKFRSPAEFFGHASWLDKSGTDLSKHKGQCTCKYSQNYAAPTTSDLSKRKPAPANGTATAKRIKPSASDKLASYNQEIQNTAVIRKSDLLSGRWFRKGELVWVKIETITRPQGGTLPDNVDHIAYWPAIIVQPQTSSELERSQTDSKPSNSQYQKYEIRFCGRLVSRGAKDPIVVDETALFPFRMLKFPLPDISQIAKQHRIDMWKNNSTDLVSPEEDLVKEWRKKWRKDITLEEARLPENWERAVVAFAHGLKFAEVQETYWTNTDAYGDPSKSDGFVGSTDAKRTYFQGLFWGPERIWKDDLVRLTRERQKLLIDGLKEPSPGAHDRGVFLLVSGICIREQQEVSKDKITYATLLFGEAFEVAERKWVEKNDPSALEEKVPEAGEDDQEAGIVKLPEAPEGFVFRRLHPADVEVSCDLFDIAGRTFPRLNDSQHVRLVEENSPDIQDRVNSLLGLAPCGEARTAAETWKNTRYEAVCASHDVASRWLSECFEMIDDPSATVAPVAGVETNGGSN